MLFHIRKYITVLYVFFKSKTNPWKKIEGIFLPVNLSVGYNTVRWILNGGYEQGEIHIIKNRLHNDDIVFEIGTGLGFISAFCAKKIGSQNVYTYEANVLNLPVIAAVFKKNSVSPTITNAYLEKTAGEFLFPVNASSRLGSSSKISTEKKVPIPMLSLNEQIRKLSPTFLVMDIEGGEFDIFSIIDFYTITKIQFELHPTILDQQKCDKIFEILAQNNFIKDESVSAGVNYFFYKK